MLIFFPLQMSTVMLTSCVCILEVVLCQQERKLVGSFLFLGVLLVGVLLVHGE